MCFSFFKKKNKQPESPLWQPETLMPELYENEQVNSTPYAQPEATRNQTVSQPYEEPIRTEYSNNLNCEFTLTEFGGNIDGGFRETNDPTEADLKRAIETITHPEGEFFTLISSEPINGYTLIGGTILYGENLITASTNIELGIKNGKHFGKSYDKSVSASEMLDLLKNFLNKRTPNINDGSWTFDEDFVEED